MKSKFLLATAGICAALMAAGCTTTTTAGVGQDPAAERRAISANVDGALTRLQAQAPDSARLLSNARGVLVFPRVLSAGLGVGGSYGKGELRVNNQTVDYYSTAAASVGLLAGADSKAVYILFMTDEALQKFRDSKGWTVGADASVSLAKAGVYTGVDTQTIKEPVVGYVLTNAGAMANISIDGTKITKIS